MLLHDGLLQSKLLRQTGLELKPFLEHGCFVRSKSTGGVRRSMASRKAEDADLSTAWRNNMSQCTSFKP